MSGTLLAFDFGTKSIGVAVGQRITGTARPLPAIKAQDGTPDWNLNERLSTVEARSGLFEQGGYRALNKGKVDSASAVIILESYFEQGY